MKASKTFIYISITALVLLTVGTLATERWRADRGWTVADVVAPQKSKSRRELRQFDRKLTLIAERRERIRDILGKFEEKEKNVSTEITEALDRLPERERASVVADLRVNVLSESNANNPGVIHIWERFQEARSVVRQTDALRDNLSLCESALSRALAERDRLERRAELIETLGYDPDEPNAPKEKNFQEIDDLLAEMDVAIAEQAERNAKLTPSDVAGSKPDDLPAEIDRITSGSVEESRRFISDELDRKLDKIKEEESARRPEEFAAAARLKELWRKYLGRALAIAIVAYVFFRRRKIRERDKRYEFNAQPQSTQTVIIQNEPPRPFWTGGLVLFVAGLTFIGCCLGGMFGGAIGLFLGFAVALIKAGVRAFGFLGGLLICVPLAFVALTVLTFIFGLIALLD